MKKYVLIVFALCNGFAVFAQNISKITITGSGLLNDIVFGLDEQVQIYINQSGQISKWGYDRFIGNMENYNDYLEPYVGRVDYYTQQDDEALRGKVKYIGRTLLTYYPSYENESLKGKLKSIGAITLNYYQSFEDKTLAGKLKSIGSQNITWYSSFENEALRGKLKSFGNTALVYYESFEDKAFRGKIKNIGGTGFTYYSSFEQFSGSMKTGNTVVLVNGIKFYLRGY